MDQTAIHPIIVRVPATSANLGSGFDVLGLALRLYNVFELRPAAITSIETVGYEGPMPRDSTNLFYRAFAHLYAVRGEIAPPLAVTMHLLIPSGSGLGSSATAVVGGLLAANFMLGQPFSREELLLHAVELEHGRHPDNVAPALFGGLVVNANDGDKIVSLRLDFPADLYAVLFTPEFEMDTVQGRKLMPSAYSCADTVFSTSRVALLLSALHQGRYDLLRVAMEDRMHQPYRTQLFPLLPKLIEAALEAGAWGACLSGGGSSVLAFATRNLEGIGAALCRVATEAGIAGVSRVLEIDQDGARVGYES